MDIFQLVITTMLIIVAIFLVMYSFYMYLQAKHKEEEEPIITNLMEYEPPSIQ
mgnify:CR=1 FL=1|tara:strand:+ start:834 stop:992 length:159 start_codon:yes stop_codon:yes gene_type:complete